MCVAGCTIEIGEKTKCIFSFCLFPLKQKFIIKCLGKRKKFTSTFLLEHIEITYTEILRKKKEMKSEIKECSCCTL